MGPRFRGGDKFCVWARSPDTPAACGGSRMGLRANSAPDAFLADSPPFNLPPQAGEGFLAAHGSSP
jgi:hypothetical protein